MSPLKHLVRDRRTAAAVASAGAIAVLGGVPVAIGASGDPVKGGARNPSANQSEEYTNETEIIANNSTYGTRQSNKSDKGGGAIYGCRSRAGGTPKGFSPCVRASNLSDGYAFELTGSNGPVIGTITSGHGGDAYKPFVTNATGVADGLNADRVDGKDASSFASAGDLLFAAVDSTGKLTANRGAAATNAVAVSGNDTTVTFARDVDACSYTATVTGTTPSAVSVTPGTAKTQVVVHAAAANTPFHLQVIC